MICDYTGECCPVLLARSILFVSEDSALKGNKIQFTLCKYHVRIGSGISSVPSPQLFWTDWLYKDARRVDKKCALKHWSSANNEKGLRLNAPAQTKDERGTMDWCNWRPGGGQPLPTPFIFVFRSALLLVHPSRYNIVILKRVNRAENTQNYHSHFCLQVEIALEASFSFPRFTQLHSSAEIRQQWAKSSHRHQNVRSSSYRP